MNIEDIKAGALVWYAHDYIAEVMDVTAPFIKVHVLHDGAIFDTDAKRLELAHGESREAFKQYNGHWLMNDDGTKRTQSILGMLCYVEYGGMLRIAEIIEIIGIVGVARTPDGFTKAEPIQSIMLKNLAKRNDWPEYTGRWIYNDDGSRVDTSQ